MRCGPDGLQVRTPRLDVVVSCPVVGVDRRGCDRPRRHRAAGSQVAGQRHGAAGAEQQRRPSLIACLQNGLENERIAAPRFADVLSVPGDAAVDDRRAWRRRRPGVRRIPGGSTSGAIRMPGRRSRVGGLGGLHGGRVLVDSAPRRLAVEAPQVGDERRQRGPGSARNRREPRLRSGDGRGRCFRRSRPARWRPSRRTSPIVKAEWRSPTSPASPAAGRRGRASSVPGSIEADYYEVCLLGRLHGVPTPVNALLHRRANAASAAGGARIHHRAGTARRIGGIECQPAPVTDHVASAGARRRPAPGSPDRARD